jgi:hypothetical protein
MKVALLRKVPKIDRPTAQAESEPLADMKALALPRFRRTNQDPSAATPMR